MTILNALRGAMQTIGSFKTTAMATLATPASKDAAVTLFFREKAFWTFGRGQRLGDERRLIRQYSGRRTRCSRWARSSRTVCTAPT